MLRFTKPNVVATLFGCLAIVSCFLLSDVDGVPANCDPTMGLHFYNWDGEKTCEPSRFLKPRTENEVIAAVQDALAYGENIKVIGAGLSFSGAQMSANATGATLMSLDNLDSIISITSNAQGALVEVQAGMRVRDFVIALEKSNLTMLNLGATATQSVVGATATGTHGTGQAIGGLASQITAVRIVDGTGVVHKCDENENTEMFQASRTGVGALGIITSVTIQAVPIWKLKRIIKDIDFDTLLNELPTMMQKHPRLQWSWIPYTNNATVIIRDDVNWDTAVSPSDGGCWSTTQPTTPVCVDVAYKALTDSWSGYYARAIYTEMEMFVPAELALDAVQDFITWYEQADIKSQYDPSIAIQGMVRYVAADNITLSPMFGRDTAVLSFIAMGDKSGAGGATHTQFELFSRGLQSVCETEKYYGRPHWGKVSYFDESTPQYLQSAYGDSQLSSFNAIRDTLDPNGMFDNAYLAERLPRTS